MAQSCFLSKDNPMSESVDVPQNETAPHDTSQPCRPRRRCHWKCGLIAGLILGSLAAVILLMVCRPQYKATATIQVRAARPNFLVDYPRISQYEYESFVNTQIALLRNPIVIDRALEQPEVARLPIVIQQRDKRGWLTQKLRAKHVGNSEIVHISIKTNSEDASEKIVNAVVDAYFQFIDEVARTTNVNLISSLRVEERRQRQLAQRLQENIRTKTREAANSEIVEAENEVDVAVELAQLKRTTEILDRIEGRIFDITAEQRAPGQISLLSRAVPSMLPSWKKAVAIAGMGFVVFFLLPLLCVACCRCCCR